MPLVVAHAVVAVCDLMAAVEQQLVLVVSELLAVVPFGEVADQELEGCHPWDP